MICPSCARAADTNRGAGHPATVCRDPHGCTCQHRPTPQSLPQPPQEPEKGANQ